MTRRLSAAAGALAVLGIGLGALHGCNATSGGLIPRLPVQIGGAARDGGGPMFFTTRQGWQVELDQAVFAVGPFYFNTQPPGSQGLQVGTVIVQVTSQSFVNALDPSLQEVDGGGSGESGAAASVEVDLFPPGCSAGGPSGNDACSTNGAAIDAYESLIDEPPPFFLENGGLASGSSAFVAGTASQADAGLVVPFYGFLTIDTSTGGNPNDPAASPLTSLQQVAGACPCAGGCGAASGCSLVFPASPSVLQIRVDPTHLFDAVDFAALIPPPDAGPAWSPDAGPLTWNTKGPDSAFNTELVEGGLQASNGVYLFNVVEQPSN